MKFPDPKCPACRGEFPHKRSDYRCDVCGIAFAVGHVAPEQNGLRVCSSCVTRAYEYATLPF